ncbi:sulfite reductase [Sediminibacterium roseum]|uniref:Sulfite reductase n=1 Tax=Sediminibacterium roseum TaxID=1978412 RepID=A0ABW9ZWS5_9BACT|nr:flavodoxin domain-containing protein [Sediminibacterium roseum]NCI49658.1 sulfite reductase [Sediminibacterium roseum]
MLDAHKQKNIEQLVAGASKDELIWMNGYISALINALPQTQAPTAAPKKITLVYGTETGNSKRVATDLAARARKNNIAVKLASLDQYRLTDITREEKLFVVISTQGDGEPPVAAQKFYDHIHRNGFRLDQLQYSVLALGDTSYPLFCKTGDDVDAQLEKLGGKRIVPIRRCDVDFERDADAWFADVLRAVEQSAGIVPAVLKVEAKVERTARKIHTGVVASHTNLNDIGSEKETYHIELIADEVDYLPGDSVGIVPGNEIRLVNEIISLTGIDAGKTVSFKENTYTVFELLQKKVSIVHLHERVVKKYAALSGQEIPEVKMDLLRLLQLYPLQSPAQFEELIALLPAQSPRIYTIASSPAAHSGEIHLTVEKDRFECNGEKGSGLCSSYLGLLKNEDRIDFFVQKNKRFRLPENDRDIIMVGPGTGIAAFRSFLSERAAVGATGKNWLFFGEDHFVSDFLYQTEIQDWHSTGVLTKVSLAFAKDQDEEVFVNQKLIAEGREVFGWLQSGAYLYVCGQKAPMSVEVENALLEIFQQHGSLSEAEAVKYFEKLKEEGRYAKDVY